MTLNPYVILISGWVQAPNRERKSLSYFIVFYKYKLLNVMDPPEIRKEDPVMGGDPLKLGKEISPEVR